MPEGTITSVMQEKRIFYPPKELSERRAKNKPHAFPDGRA